MDFLKYVHPVESVIPVRGLTRAYTFLHVTDLHSSRFTDEEAASMPRNRLDYITARRRDWGYEILTEDRMPAFFEYADSIGADAVLMTGDMLDFPSDGNVKLLYDCVESAKTPCVFTPGNHDWSFADDYHTTYAETVQMPKLAGLCRGDTLCNVVEYPDLILCALDNCRDYVTEEAVRRLIALEGKGKPIVLMMHIPLRAETLDADTVAYWRRNLTMGPHGLHEWDANVRILYREAAERPDSPVALVVAGHIHIHHEDKLPNGVPQVVTAVANTGACRVIRLIPAN